MKGFKFAGICAGIKKSRTLDLGLIYSEKPVCAAALFTKNQGGCRPCHFRQKNHGKGHAPGNIGQFRQCQLFYR